MTELYNLIKAHVPASAAVVLLAVCTLCEISKMPINPWGALGKIGKKAITCLGKVMVGDVSGQLEAVSCKLQQIELSQKLERKQNLRRSILRFADECRIGVCHSREMFVNTLSDIDEYYVLCRDTEDPNEVIKEAISYIKEIDHQCMVDNDYL
jgi:hypothetical protein